MQISVGANGVLAFDPNSIVGFGNICSVDPVFD